jgi:hypothetical protein
MLAGSTIDLGEHELEPVACNYVNIDVRGKVPGSIIVELSVNGDTGQGIVVEACNTDDGSLVTVAGALMRNGSAAALGPLMPGSYVLLLRPIDETWNWSSPSDVSVASGQATRVSIPLTLVGGTFRIRLSNKDKPESAGTILIQSDSVHKRRWISLTPSADGTFQAVLPPDRYSIRYGRSLKQASESKRSYLTWPLAEGPDRIVVVRAD